MHRTTRLGVAATAVLLTTGALAPSASAAGPAALTCGAVVTTDVVLTTDLVDCPGDGLVVGASGITIDLAGHSISGSGVFTSRSGVDNEEHHGVTVRGGSISGFGAAVRAWRAAGGVVRDVQVTGTIDGISLEETTGYELSGNRLIGNRTGVQLLGAVDTLVHGNVVRRSTTTGISDDGSTGSTYAANTVVGSAHDGIDLEQAASATVRDTTIRHSGLDGLRVDGESPGLLVLRVDASHNDDHGVALSASAPTVTATTADHNGLVGISAPDDTVDGGGNRARGNGQTDCTGVVCA